MDGMPEEGELTFGQLLALFLLIQPASAIFEHFVRDSESELCTYRFVDCTLRLKAVDQNSQVPTSGNKPHPPKPHHRKQPTMSVIAATSGQAQDTMSDVLCATTLPTLKDMTDKGAPDHIHDLVVRSKSFQSLVWHFWICLLALLITLYAVQFSDISDGSVPNPYDRITILVFGAPGFVVWFLLFPAFVLPFSTKLS